MMKIFINAFLILLFTASIGACNPFKATDPSDPKFNPDKFSFSDYKTPEDLRDAFRTLFPVGTDRAFVEKVLVKAGGAVIVTEYKADEGKPIYTFVRYSERYNPFRQFKEAPFHICLYDEGNKLINVRAWGWAYLYKDQPTNEDLNRMKKESNHD